MRASGAVHHRRRRAGPMRWMRQDDNDDGATMTMIGGARTEAAQEASVEAVINKPSRRLATVL